MRRFGLVLVGSALAVVVSCADSIQFKPVADTAIFAAKPTSNFGKEGALPLGTINNSSDPGRVLLKFDLGTLPAGAVVTNVSLQLTVVKQRSGGGPKGTIGAHRMSRAWGEGAKAGTLGAVASNGEATWQAAAVGQGTWTVPGGSAGTDFVAASSGTAILGGPANYTFASTADLVADVQAWAKDPAANFGWVLVSQQENVRGNAKRVASREDAARSPVLTVQFTLAPLPPPVARFDRIALRGDAAELGFRALAGNIYTVSVRDRAGDGPWQPLTNVVSKLQDADAVVTDPVGAAARFYQVAVTGQVD
jgi:hypothetical protein